jgi:hypothetical protein
MALWGTADSIISTGTVTVNYANKTITGSGTSFTAATVGSVISIGVGNTFGEAVISGITSDTLISIATTQFLSGAAISGVAYTMSQKPVYVMQDSNYSPTSTSSDNKIYGVDPSEAVTHAGWVGIKTYVDSSGNLRVKSETLVAFSGITTGTATYTSYGDAQGDDVIFKDVYIVISSQPSNYSVGVGTTVTFSVTAATVPSGGSLSYQWQKSTTAGGNTFSNIGGETSSTVSIANTNTNNSGYRYRVVVSATGADNVTSNYGTLTVS